MYKVLESRQLVPNIHILRIESEFIPQKAQAGQFVILQADEQGERIPLNIADWDENSISVVFLQIGTSTRKLADLKEGDSLYAFVGPLGRPTEMPVGKNNVLCIGGCYGIGATYPAVREFKKRGNHVSTVIEARSESLFFWENKLSAVSDEILYITRDGNKGFQGHIDSFLRDYSFSHHVSGIVIPNFLHGADDNV